MNKELKNLTKKYFWQQKIFEVFLFLIGLLFFIMIPFLLGLFIGDNEDITCGANRDLIEKCDNIILWFEGVAYIILFLMGLLMIGAFIILIIVILIPP